MDWLLNASPTVLNAVLQQNQQSLMLQIQQQQHHQEQHQHHQQQQYQQFLQLNQQQQLQQLQQAQAQAHAQAHSQQTILNSALQSNVQPQLRIDPLAQPHSIHALQAQHLQQQQQQQQQQLAQSAPTLQGECIHCNQKVTYIIPQSLLASLSPSARLSAIIPKDAENNPSSPIDPNSSSPTLPLLNSLSASQTGPAEHITCTHCEGLLSIDQLIRQSKENYYYELLSAFKSHFNQAHSALVWLATSKPTRTGKLAIPRSFRWPKATSGRGGYADAFWKLGLQLRKNDTFSGHWHCWYVDRSSTSFAALQSALLRCWRESPSFTHDLPMSFLAPVDDHLQFESPDEEESGEELMDDSPQNGDQSSLIVDKSSPTNDKSEPEAMPIKMDAVSQDPSIHVAKERKKIRRCHVDVLSDIRSFDNSIADLRHKIRLQMVSSSRQCVQDSSIAR